MLWTVILVVHIFWLGYSSRTVGYTDWSAGTRAWARAGSRTFLAPQKQPICCPPGQRPPKVMSFFLVPSEICLASFWMSYKLNHTVCLLLHLAYFTQHYVWEAHLCSCGWQWFILFYCSALFPVLNQPQFIYPSHCGLPFGSFPLLGCSEQTCLEYWIACVGTEL